MEGGETVEMGRGAADGRERGAIETAEDAQKDVVGEVLKCGAGGGGH